MTYSYYLLGENISGSPSPYIFNKAFKTLEIDATYDIINVPSGKLIEEFSNLKAKGANGMNITIPFKTQVITLLDGLDPLSASIGAVNTVKSSNGKYIGYNTDVEGIVDSLSSHRLGPTRKALLFGTGGVARAFCGAMHKINCKDIVVVARSEQKARTFVEFMKKSFPELNIVFDVNGDLLNRNYDVIFNGTPPGSLDDRTLLKLSNIITDKTVVFDAVYNPVNTDLLKLATKLGGKPIYGFEMLLNQALHAFKIWTGREPPRDIMSNYIYKFLGVTFQ